MSLDETSLASLEALATIAQQAFADERVTVPLTADKMAHRFVEGGGHMPRYVIGAPAIILAVTPGSDVLDQAYAEFIAAASPDVVLALIAALRAARGDVERWREYAEHVAHCVDCGNVSVDACWEGRTLRASAMEGPHAD